VARIFKTPHDPFAANGMAAWILIAIGVVGEVSVILGVQNYTGLPNFTYAMGWENFDSELRLNIVAIALVIIAIFLFTFGRWARVAAMLASLVMVVICAMGMVLLFAFISHMSPPVVLAQGPLDVIWIAAFLWVALTLARPDVAALYEWTPDPEQQSATTRDELGSAAQPDATRNQP
jgi:hypothetical protein